jgi:hypothetical protein
MSNRKGRGGSTEVASRSKQQRIRDSEDQPARSRHSPHPPRRNVTLLSASFVLFVTWILFLVYVALFE